jgi:hypothetical protein
MMRQSALMCVMIAAAVTGGAAQAADPPSPDSVPPAPQSATTPPPPDAGSAPPAASAQSPPAAVQPPAKSAVQSVPPEDAEAILGQLITGPEGKEVGRLVDVLVDANGQPQAAVIDFGGFMGVGNRKIAVHWSVLRFSPGDPKHKITLEMTPDQIKAAPEFLNPNKAASVVTPAVSAQAPQ